MNKFRAPRSHRSPTRARARGDEGDGVGTDVVEDAGTFGENRGAGRGWGAKIGGAMVRLGCISDLADQAVVGEAPRR
jgi:hypothetical protein